MVIDIKQIYKSYGRDSILSNVNFSLERDNILVLLGPSGCGKSTLLKIICGLEKQDSGTIYVHNMPLDTLPIDQRGIIYLNQVPLLFPHMNVFENLAYGLRVRSLPEEDIRSRVLSMASHLTIHDHLDKKPHQLSGGQQQRVSFGRAIIIEPQILLLDEPFASLDSATRDEMQKLFLTLAKQHNLTAIFVTHDLKEALLISDQIGVMQNHSVHIYPEKSNFISQYAERVNKEYEFWAKYTQF